MDTSARLNRIRRALLKFEISMINKYGTRRFALRYLRSEQRQHNVLRRALRNALWSANGFDPASVVVDPELSTIVDETPDAPRKTRKNAPIPVVKFIPPVAEPGSEEYVTGVSAADLLRNVMSN